MQIVKTYSIHDGHEFWTHDAILNNNVAGRINEPIIVTTGSGEQYVPATIVYIKDQLGTRRYKNETYRRDLVDYVRDISKLDRLGLGEYKLYDPISQTYFVGIPLNDSVIIGARESLVEVSSNHIRISEPLSRLTKYFRNTDFGVIGSVQLGLDGEDSDVDLVIYGGEEYFGVVRLLMEPKIQKLLGITFQDQKRVDKNALKYQERYSVPFDQAQLISSLRSRFSVMLKNGSLIKMGLNSSYKKGEYDGLTIIGARKLKDVTVKGRVVNTVDSCSFPRQYLIEKDGKPILVASHHWGHQLLANNGDSITLSGSLRQRENGDKVIFMEDDRKCFRRLGLLL